MGTIILYRIYVHERPYIYILGACDSERDRVPTFILCIILPTNRRTAPAAPPQIADDINLVSCMYTNRSAFAAYCRAPVETTCRPRDRRVCRARVSVSCRLQHLRSTRK